MNTITRIGDPAKFLFVILCTVFFFSCGATSAGSGISDDSLNSEEQNDEQLLNDVEPNDNQSFSVKSMTFDLSSNDDFGPVEGEIDANDPNKITFTLPYNILTSTGNYYVDTDIRNILFSSAFVVNDPANASLKELVPINGKELYTTTAAIDVLEVIVRIKQGTNYVDMHVYITEGENTQD